MLELSSLERFEGETKLSEITDKSLAKNIQSALKSIGYEIVVDGLVGRSTQECFAKWKRSSYLEHPDILGIATKKLLLADYKDSLGTATHVLDVDEQESIIKHNPADLGTRTGVSITLPSGDRIWENQMILPGGHFTWKEALKPGLVRKPTSSQEVQNILETARWMEKVREVLGDDPLGVTSFYRPIYLRIGAINSQHTKGNAVDFIHTKLTAYQCYLRLDNISQDRGLAYAPPGKGSFCHTENDNRGYRARWVY
jgi:hypothetical protein